MELWEFALVRAQNMTCYCQGHGNRARARARALTSGDGKKKYGHSGPVGCSKAKIRSTAGNILGKIKARGISRQDHRAILPVLFRARGGGVPGGTKGARAKQRNVTFDVSPETAEMAAHCLDYKLIWRSIPRRATSCARPCTR